MNKPEQIEKITEMLSEIQNLSIPEQAEAIYNKGYREVPENSTPIDNELLKEVAAMLNKQVEFYLDKMNETSKEESEWEVRRNERTGMNNWVPKPKMLRFEESHFSKPLIFDELKKDKANKI